MKSIVITGGTRGIGYALVEQFLSRGCVVTFCGRNLQHLETAIQSLTQKYSAKCFLGCHCDVRNFADVQALWESATQQFKQVDIWINNAGVTHPRLPVWEQNAETLLSVVETNLTASLYGSKVAISGMLKQGFGALYNMEGSGSGGMKVKNLTLYGTTKYAIRFLTESLVTETKETSIIVGAISPGIVITDLLMGQYDDENNPMPLRTKRLLNILADKVETVSPYLVEQILLNQKTGVRIAWLTTSKVLRRFLFSPFNNRNLFS